MHIKKQTHAQSNKCILPLGRRFVEGQEGMLYLNSFNFTKCKIHVIIWRYYKEPKKSL